MSSSLTLGDAQKLGRFQRGSPLPERGFLERHFSSLPFQALAAFCVVVLWVVAPAGAQVSERPTASDEMTVAWAMFGVTPMSRSRSGTEVGVSWSAGDRLAEPGALILEVDGDVIPIDVLAAAEDPLEMEILRDESRSMDYGDRVAESLAVLDCVTEQLQQRDVIRLAGFAEAGAKERVAATGDRGAIDEALMAWPTKGVTSLLDALSWLSRDVRPGAGALRKISVVVTDGGDNSSRLTLRETRALLGQIDHAVVILDAAGHEHPYGRPGRDRASLLLRELAQATGGIWVSTAAPEAACRSLAQLARSHLLVGFPVDVSTKPANHRLRLRLGPDFGDRTVSRRQIVLRHRRQYLGHSPSHVPAPSVP